MNERNEFSLGPVMCSQGGFPYNGEHIEYWKKRALAAERLRAPAPSAWQPKGPREVLDALADKVSAKIVQLEHYKANDCQLDHARTIAEGRISQANQILHWIAEAAISFPSLPSSDRGGVG